MVASTTTASPTSGMFLESTPITLSTTPAATIFWQRYAQSAEDVYDITSRI